MMAFEACSDSAFACVDKGRDESLSTRRFGSERIAWNAETSNTCALSVNTLYRNEPCVNDTTMIELFHRPADLLASRLSMIFCQ